jgi:hypothetical protein
MANLRGQRKTFFATILGLGFGFVNPKVVPCGATLGLEAESFQDSGRAFYALYSRAGDPV